ncbi:MAG: hypothetical protein EA417_07065 [Gammaproteobacteria bacterium]|nr:MAG: hypothetical protein EA417_07065 [Gammaproteobacteria bacterium]
MVLGLALLLTPSQRLFGTVALDGVIWLRIMSFCLLGLFSVELEKTVLRVTSGRESMVDAS